MTARAGIVIKAAIVCAAALAAFEVHAAMASATPQSGSLSETELWVKIVAGILTAVATLVGLPAGFLQLNKTIAETKKLRLETAKLNQEVGGASETQRASHSMNIQVSDSKDTIVNVVTDARLVGPMLVVLDFIFAFILYQAYGILSRLSPFGGFLGEVIMAGLSLAVFLLLFVPVFLSARQVRALLREIAEADAKRSEAVRAQSAAASG